MNIRKQVLTSLNGCYAVNSLVLNGQPHIVLASEAEGGSCRAWKAPDYTDSHAIWDGPGGTMSIVPIPGSDGEFLAVQKFFRMYDWEGAKIVHVRPTGANAYDVKDVLPLPYVHRFDLLPVNGRNYFIACTLARKKTDRRRLGQPGLHLGRRVHRRRPRRAARAEGRLDQEPRLQPAGNRRHHPQPG